MQKLYFFNKRGVSPLIATVLLISFAVALDSVVLNWGRNVDLTGGGCSGVSMKIRNIGDAEACYSGSGQNGYINFFIDNTGNKDIDGLDIWIMGEKGTKLWPLDLTLRKGELLSVNDKSVTYDFDKYGVIKEIRFFPKVKIEGSLKTCDNSINADKLEVC